MIGLARGLRAVTSSPSRTQGVGKGPVQSNECGAEHSERCGKGDGLPGLWNTDSEQTIITTIIFTALFWRQGLTTLPTLVLDS
jgi:hypothetical protein